MARVKICGITNVQDATWAATIGAEYLGFNFCDTSPRKVSVKMASDILGKLPPIIDAAGVFVDEQDTAALVKTCAKLNLKLVQLHGAETPEYCAELKERLSGTGRKLMKAFRIKDMASLDEIPKYADIVDYLLLDTCVEGVEGGTGETFNWEIAREAHRFGKQFFLAGGLTPENVTEAVLTVGPFAVDVASGVERLPKRKDFEKLKNFIVNAKKA